MLGFLKKTLQPKSIEEISFKGKTTNEIIEEIHESFYSEVDKLLASAKVLKSLETNQQELIDKCHRLKALGFANTQEVKQAEAELSRLSLLKSENENKKTLIEAIDYFSHKYPNYKFITEDSVKKICEKYSLIYGSIDKYIGTVPDKNLKQMEDFKVLEDDECYVSGTDMSMYDIKSTIHYINKEASVALNNHARNSRLTLLEGFPINMKCPLEIAAPLKDFKMKDHEVKNFKISKIDIPDPIVLKPVIFNNQKHYLIVTAWGIEAGDELIVNPRHN